MARAFLFMKKEPLIDSQHTIPKLWEFDQMLRCAKKEPGIWVAMARVVPLTNKEMIPIIAAASTLLGRRDAHFPYRTARQLLRDISERLEGRYEFDKIRQAISEVLKD